MTATNSFIMIGTKLFIAVEDGVVIYDTESPWDRRFIRNSFYDDIYPTPFYDMLKDQGSMRNIVDKVLSNIRNRKRKPNRRCQ